MKKRVNLLLALAIAGTMSANAQVRIGGGVVPNASAVLDLNPDDQTTLGNSEKGLAMPRVNLVSTTDCVPLLAHIPGMTVFNMVSQNDVTPGIYYNDGTKWLRLSSGEVQLPEGVNEGDVFVWNPSLDQWEAKPEKDGVVGNEVTNVTDGSLSRSGAGTVENPYTLAVAENGIETKHLKDDAVTTQKIADNSITTGKIVNKSVTQEKLADNAVSTINIVDNSIVNQKIVNKSISKDKLGDDVWLEITNEISNISLIEADGVIGNEVTNATDGSLVRSGLGTTVSPYTLAVSESGIDNKHLKDGSITNTKIVNKTISKEKLGDDVWNEVKTEIINSSIGSEVDGIIGNEVIGSADASLTRTGSGTGVSPYRLGVSNGGIETIHLKDGSVTTNKITDNAVTQQKIANNSIINQQIVNKTISKDKLADDVWTEITNEINNISVEEIDSIIGNEVTNTTDGSLARSGTGTSDSPFTLAVAAGGIDNKHLKDISITHNKIVDKTITKEKLGDDVWNQITNKINNISLEEIDGIIGNEVTNATDGSLVRSGLGTQVSPFTLAVATGGIDTKHLKDGSVTSQKIADNSITTDKLADAQSNSILYTDGANQWKTFERKVTTGVFNVPNDSLSTRFVMELPDWGSGLYGIHITCDSDLPHGDISSSYFRFITDVKPYGVGTRDVYFSAFENFDRGDSHTTTAWLYNCKPKELEFYVTNKGDKVLNFQIVCSWLMPY